MCSWSHWGCLATSFVNCFDEKVVKLNKLNYNFQVIFITLSKDTVFDLAILQNHNYFTKLCQLQDSTVGIFLVERLAPCKKTGFLLVKKIIYKAVVMAVMSFCRDKSVASCGIDLNTSGLPARNIFA